MDQNIDALAGKYFKATNPAFGTGIAQSIVTGFLATSPILSIFNSAGSGGLSIHPDYIKLICTAAGATSTAAHLAIVLDVINRFSSGGSTITAANPNSGSSTTSKAVINFGALVATAASAARQIGRDAIKTQAAPCWVVGDEVFIKFGNFDNTFGPTNGAASNIYPAPTGPVVIAPGHTLLLYLWNVANATTAPSWEFEMGWAERP